VIAIESEGGWKLRTNGLPEAMILPPGRAVLDPTNSWLSALPTLARPEARSLLVIGLGGGLVLDGVPGSIAAVDVIELEPQVIEANRRLADRRGRDPLADPRVRLVENDARGALELTDERWNGIVSQPSHPWTAGASHLYTREFFQLVRERLEPGGVFVQWMGLGFIDAELLRSLVATLADVFPHVAVLRPGIGASLLFAGSDAPLDFASTLAGAREASPAALDALGLATPEDVASQVLLEDAGARAFTRGAPVSTDDRNLLQMRSPRILAKALAPEQVAALVAPFDPLEPPRGLDAPRLVRRLIETAQPARAARIAAAVEEPARRREAEALVGAARSGDVGELRSVVAADPGAREAAAALVLQSRASLVAGTADPVTSAAAASEPAAALVLAWRAETSGDAAALRALDGRLAAVDAAHPLFAEALRLRVEARLATGDRRDAEAAVQLADLLAARLRRSSIWLPRVRALAASGQPAAALGDLEEIAASLGGERTAPRYAQRLLNALRAIPPDPALAERRAALQRRLEADSTPGGVVSPPDTEGGGA
jgi:spermidine synthase